MVDLLDMWWQWPLLVERKTGDGPEGPQFATGRVILGKITQKRKLVRTGPDSEVLSEARVSFPALTPLIPVGSLVTFPDAYGARRAEVLAEQLHHSGMDATPNFYSIDLT